MKAETIHTVALFVIVVGGVLLGTAFTAPEADPPLKRTEREELANLRLEYQYLAENSVPCPPPKGDEYLVYHHDAAGVPVCTYNARPDFGFVPEPRREIYKAGAL